MTDSLNRALPRTSSVIQAGIERGLHSGFQIFVSLRGDVIADTGVGEAGLSDENGPPRPMTANTLVLWLSAGKPLTATAVLQLVESKRLELDTAVASAIPEFASGGKESITLRHLLTHTGGFRNVETGWPTTNWDEAVSRVCAAPLEEGWQIGETAGYHPSSSWFILGEIIARVSERSFSAYLREKICEPLGMLDTWNGMPPEFRSQNEERLGGHFQRERGRTEMLPWHDELHCAAASPGVNTRGPIRELGQFYESLLAGLCDDECPILSQESVSLLTGRHREGAFDETLRHQVDFGLGVIVNSNRYRADTVPYGFGRFCSMDTFGHGGAQSSIGFADRQNELVVAWAANVRAGEGQHQRRNREINSAIYEDLGLSG